MQIGKGRLAAGIHLGIAALIAAAVCAGPARAQRSKPGDAGTRSVKGIVSDPQNNPVSGAVVQLKNMRSLQIRSFITTQNGGYHFSGLKTDVDYQVKADYNGMSSGTKTISVFDSRKEPVIDLKLEKK
ncbi:MAG TPA: carboxypeptidase-like regulatory domain-containing protein [Bryobacteraceae bacterium]|nr:carboxypeptidase-like regulatory domain-containing protein [Bryobacteraceae bacterium]